MFRKSFQRQEIDRQVSPSVLPQSQVLHLPGPCPVMNDKIPLLLTGRSQSGGDALDREAGEFYKFVVSVI